MNKRKNQDEEELKLSGEDPSKKVKSPSTKDPLQNALSPSITPKQHPITTYMKAKE